MDLMSRTLNKLDAFLKGKRVMRTIPSSALPKGTDLTKYKIKNLFESFGKTTTISQVDEDETALLNEDYTKIEYSYNGH